MRRSRSSLAAVAAALAVGTAAAAAETPRRRVAVLEVRVGSTAAPDIGAKLAARLEATSSLDVMSPDAARRSYGAALDAKVTGCVGQARCVGRMAAALEVDEILLVGVSELGDVILTLQRIDRRGAVAARLAEAMPAGTAPSASDLDRFLRRVFPESDFQRFGSIRVEANIRGASVFFGERKVGITPLAPVRVLAPRDYEVRVAKSGYSPFRANIAVAPESEVRVNPELTALPDDAWYKRWWVLAIAGGVAAAATVGTVVLMTSDSGDVPVSVEPF